MLSDKNALFVLDGFPPASLVFAEEAETNNYAREILDNFLPKVGLPYVTLQVSVDNEVLQ